MTARHAGDDVELTFTHPGTGTAVLKLKDGRSGRTTTVRVRPGAVVRRTVDLGASRRWYDLTVTADHEPSYLRRFVGHVENGRPGVSDPGLVTD